MIESILDKDHPAVCTICNFEHIIKPAAWVACSADGLEWFECEPGAHANDANAPYIRVTLLRFDEWKRRNRIFESSDTQPSIIVSSAGAPTELSRPDRWPRDAKRGDIVHHPHTWELACFELCGQTLTHDVTRNAAIYSYFTTQYRWMDTIELEPLITLPCGQDLVLTFKNVSSDEHNCIVLLKCFTDAKVFYMKLLPEGKAGPGSTYKSGLRPEETCTLTRFFIATEPWLLARLPGMLVQ